MTENIRAGVVGTGLNSPEQTKTGHVGMGQDVSRREQCLSAHGRKKIGTVVPAVLRKVSVQ